jgi:energy-coupling factor transport system ATP-binding protein
MDSTTNQILHFIEGENFSGRSAFLDNIVENEGSLIIKELPTNNISGIFPTVVEELKLHYKGDNPLIEQKIWEFLWQIHFDKHFYKNPFTLSGGEQTVLAIMSNLLLNQKILCIDTTIEQLNENWYRPVFEFLQTNKELFGRVYIADNRYKEYKLENIIVLKSDNAHKKHPYRFELPKLIDINSNIESTHTLSIKDLSFRYDQKQTVLSKLNFEFNSSTIYHLGGKNGSGKSTLAKILAGVLKVDKNLILLDGNSYNCYTSPGSICGYSFQNPDEQLFSNSIEKEILPFRKNENVEYTNRRDFFLKIFGLQHIRKNHPAEMPFVIRKRIALASTLAMDKPFYILDEPTLGQDENFVDFFASLIYDLKKLGKGIILITHCRILLDKIDYKELSLSD